MARWVADICIGIGAAIFTVQTIRAIANLIKRRRARCVPVDAQLLPCILSTIISVISTTVQI